MSLRAYGRHRGTSAVAVLRAVRRGRLVQSVVLVGGKAKIADPALADQEWEANTDLSRAPGYVKERQAPTAAGPSPSTAATPAKGPSPLTEASAREKAAKANLAELEYRRRAGELVQAVAVEARVVELVTQARTKLLGVPAKAKQALPHLSAADVRVLDRLIREALTELAERAEPTGSAA